MAKVCPLPDFRYCSKAAAFPWSQKRNTLPFSTDGISPCAAHRLWCVWQDGISIRLRSRYNADRERKGNAEYKYKTSRDLLTGLLVLLRVLLTSHFPSHLFGEEMACQGEKNPAEMPDFLKTGGRNRTRICDLHDVNVAL